MDLVSDSLAGRVAIIELATLSMREIQGVTVGMPFLPTLDYVKTRKLTARDPGNIWNMIHRGGYPELQNKETDWAMFFSSYIKTYLERDVRPVDILHCNNTQT